jgi:outer membrane protein insertion porin family
MMSRRLSRFCLLALIGSMLGVSAGSAAAEDHVAPLNLSQLMPISADAALRGAVIRDIKVEGNERIEPETVISYLTVAKGDTATQDKLDLSLKALYATGLFADVAIGMDGSTLRVKVAENPILNRVVFEGNDAISKEDLEKEVQLKSRFVYTLPKVQKDVQRILDLYRREGRFAATVEPKIVKLEQNRVDLIFEINEGKRTGIRNIAFVGNTHFPDDRLTSVISTHESAWWRFFSTTDYYDPDRLNYDKELLRKFYQNEGYVDFRVLSAVAELTPDKDDFFITFTVEEGQRYHFGKVNIKSEIKGLDGETLRQYLTTREGGWYAADQIEKTIAKLTTVLGDMQYAFVNIVPDTDRHKDSLTVDLTYDIKESERVYVGRINITGNTRTVDKVIRREIPLAESDPFSSTAVHKGEQNLKDLNFFETAKVTPVQGSQPDRTDLNVDLKEKSTGEVAIGAGFSSTDGPLGDFSISEHNFMGEGQDARIGATVSGRTDQIDTSFTEPHFLDRDLSAGIDLFGIRSNNQDLASYDVDTAGFNLRMGYPLSQQLRQTLNYSFHDDTISNVPSDASLYILDQAGTSVTSAVGQSLIYDTRDSKLTPTEGFVTHLDTDFAGVGGSRRYLRMRVGGTQFIPFDEKWILSTTAEVGKIWGLNGSTKINERFFLGGDSLRGFEYAGVGPRDLTSSFQDALGGTQFARGSLQLSMPSPVPEELGITPHIFTDAGILDHVDENAIAGDTFAADGNLRLSVGVGVVWQSPFGPVGLDFAEPVMKKSYDSVQHINFNFGTKF